MRNRLASTMVLGGAALLLAGCPGDRDTPTTDPAFEQPLPPPGPATPGVQPGTPSAPGAQPGAPGVGVDTLQQTPGMTPPP